MGQVEIADTLAKIASQTTDPETGRQLMELVDRLLTEVGLSPDDTG
jgi:hypothetical protein